MKFRIKGTLYCETRDAANLLERSIYTVQKWARQGRLVGAMKIGRNFMIPFDSIEKMRQLLSVARSEVGGVIS